MTDPAVKEMFFFFVRLVCVGGFALTLAAGFYLKKNRQAIFGINPDDPSENASARNYNALQILAVWAHLLVFFALGAMLLH